MGRFTLKISGEALIGHDGFGTSPHTVTEFAKDIKRASDDGHEVAVVVGGGNYFRGGSALDWHIPRAELDNVGILGTVINGIFLRGALLDLGADVRLMTAIPIPSIGEPYIRLKAEHHLKSGRIPILAGGNGQPYVTTDYPAVQRAIELDADMLLVAKHGVQGIMTADPRVDNEAQLLDHLTYEDALERRLRVMDQAAFVLAMEHDLALRVFDVAELNRLADMCNGQDIGTVVSR